MKEPALDEAKKEVQAPKVAEKATAPTGTKPTDKPKKSKKGCCFGIAVVFILLFLTSSGAVGFFDFLPWHGNYQHPDSFIPDFISKNDTSAPPATSTDDKSIASNKSSNTGTATSNNQTASSTETPATTPADNVTTTTPQPGAGTQTPPSTGAQVQTTFTKQEQIDFFVQVAMKNDQNNFATSPIQKWRTTTGVTAKIRYYNDPTGTNLSCADATISQVNALSNTIHFSKTTGNDYNIRVYFVPKSQIGSGIGGYYNLSTDASHYVTGGNAYVPSDTYNDADRCHYIRHEMVHVMTGLAFNGLKNHGGYDFSLFNVSAGRSEMLEIDKYAIKIMLNSGVGLGWSESQVRSLRPNFSSKNC